MKLIFLVVKTYGSYLKYKKNLIKKLRKWQAKSQKREIFYNKKILFFKMIFKINLV